MSTKITVIIDDINGAEKGFLQSYGFAALIELNDKKVLFDAGTDPSYLIKNLNAYGIKPPSLDGVILSHNHYDHTNGLSSVLQQNLDIPIYINKYWGRPVSFSGINLPPKNLILVEKARECKELCSGLYITNTHTSSDYGGIHEQACYIKSENAYTLLCGCCHPGLNRFLGDRKELGIQDDSPLNLMGGMHEFRFSDERAKELNPIVKKVILFHCTQNAPVYRSQFGEKCSIGILGRTIIV